MDLSNLVTSLCPGLLHMSHSTACFIQYTMATINRIVVMKIQEIKATYIYIYIYIYMYVLCVYVYVCVCVYVYVCVCVCVCVCV